MLILKMARKCLKFLGIIPFSEEYLPTKFQKHKLLINCIHLILVLILLLQFFCSVIYFYLFESKTFAEYHESVVIMLYIIFELIICLVLIWKRSQLISFMENLGEVIKRSKKYYLNIHKLITYLL